MLLAETLNTKTIHAKRLAAVSGAGFKAVGMADSIQSDDFTMEFARLGSKTLSLYIQGRLRADALRVSEGIGVTNV